MKRLCALAGVLFTALHEQAEAKERRGGPEPVEDGSGVYGRFDGDLTYAIGPEFLFSPGTSRPSLGATFGISFYQSLGLRFGFEQAISGSPFATERAVTARFTVSPLFLLRFRDNGQFGSAFWDLTLDSLTLFLGPVVSEPKGGTFGSAVNFDAGLSFGLPLFADATGLWLRPLGHFRSGPNVSDFVFGASLEYQFLGTSGFLPKYD